MSRYTNEEIIKAYQETGSVWRAGKKLGLAGQTVHEKLKAIGYKIPGAEWTEDEITELKSLVDELTIAQIANRLGRPYNGVALKISRLGIGDRFGNKRKQKIPKNGKYTKAVLGEYIAEIEEENLKITRFANQKGLHKESLTKAFQRYFPDWWEAYAEANAAKPKTHCPNCQEDFYPQSGKQIYCTRKCADDFRVDQSYFGGNRKNTIGLAEGVCQLCNRKPDKALSSHHMIGKENDPENKYLIALCSGCHNIVTILAGRGFAATEEAWEVLIQLVLIRKYGHQEDMNGVFSNVDIDFITDENASLYEEI